MSYMGKGIECYLDIHICMYDVENIIYDERDEEWEHRLRKGFGISSRKHP